MSSPNTGLPELILITNGPTPIFAAGSYQHHLLEVLSQRFNGRLWTWSWARGAAQVESFAVTQIGLPRRWTRPLYPYYLLRLCLLALQLRRREGSRPRLVWTYDPFLNGFGGCLVATILGCALVIEVNGSYTNPDNYLDIPQGWQKRLKLGAMRAVSAITLSRANGIKLLFPGQVDNMKFLRRAQRIQAFPCLTVMHGFARLPEQPYILFVGHPLLLKGVDVLAKAFSAVANEHPEWQLMFIGYGLRAGLEELGLWTNRMIFRSSAAHTEIGEHMGHAGIFVLPSRAEGMGRVLVEAAACGVARIGSRVDGIPTTINDGADGILVTPGSVEELAGALHRLMGDAALRATLGAAAAQRAQDEFSEEAFVKNVVEFARNTLMTGER